MSVDGRLIKVCGITRLADALHALREGATALGFVFWPPSPRVISPERAAEIIASLPAPAVTVGVFVNEPPTGIERVVAMTGIDLVQLHGDETPESAGGIGRPVLKAVTLEHVDETVPRWPPDTTWLLDALDPVRRGGTSRTIDWRRAADVARHRRVVLAGGLTPVNVAEAIQTVRPHGVDVSSGVEMSPGIKDAAKLSQFLASAQRAYEKL